MRVFVSLACLCLLVLAAARPALAGSPPLEVRVDPRVELMSVIFRLAGNPEYNRPRVPTYTAAVEQHFRQHAKHPAVAYASMLRKTRGVSFDAVMALAIHLTDIQTLEPIVPLDPRPQGLDSRWVPAEAKAFLEHVRAFVAETGFEAWFAGHQALHEKTTRRMRAALKDHAQLAWVESFFGVPPVAGSETAVGKGPQAKFSLSLGMLNGGQCYGPRVVYEDGRSDIHCVLGVWLIDDAGNPRFDKSVMPTVVHEFCHSFCNPLVDAHAESLLPIGARLWPAVADRMRRQAYGNARTMLYESLVRASVVRYQASVEGAAAAREQVASEEQLGFLWIDELAAALAQYEQKRDRYLTLEKFMPTVAATLEAYAAEAERSASVRPKVVSLLPANGDGDVDPATTQVVVTFDRPMRDGAWSFVGGGPNFPKVTGQPTYDSARKILTLPVELKPEWSYEFWLNRGKFSSFQSQEGVPLASMHVRFKTGKIREK